MAARAPLSIKRPNTTHVCSNVNVVPDNYNSKGKQPKKTGTIKGIAEANTSYVLLLFLPSCSSFHNPSFNSIREGGEKLVWQFHSSTNMKTTK